MGSGLRSGKTRRPRLNEDLCPMPCLAAPKGRANGPERRQTVPGRLFCPFQSLSLCRSSAMVPHTRPGLVRSSSATGVPGLHAAE